MRRIAAAVLVLMLLAGALAEEAALSFETYAARFEAAEEAVWEEEGAGLIYALSTEEGVTVSVCLSEESVAAVTVEFPCGEPGEAVRGAIENLGWLSEEAVAEVFSMEEGATLEAGDFTVCRIHGDDRDAFSICRTENLADMLWQPIHGGARLHDTPRCSGMDVSRMITAEAAELTGWAYCGICMKDS